MNLNWGNGKQSKGSKPLSDDEENTVSQGAGITHQDDYDRKKTFKEAYYEKYSNLFGPGDSKYEEALERGKDGQFIPEEDNDTKQHHIPVVVVDKRTPLSKETARKNLFQKCVSFESSTKSSPGSYQHPRSSLEESNQPLDFSQTKDDNIPLGVDIHDNYLSMHDKFDVNTKYSKKTNFITGQKDCEHIRSKAIQRDVLKRHRMGEELRKDSQFSDGYGKVMCSDYLKTETDRLALASKEHHLEKILKYHYAHFVENNVIRGADIKPNLDGLKRGMPTNRRATTEDVMPYSLEYNSYRSSIEEAWHEVEQKKREIDILKKEHNDYAQCSENLQSKAEERIKERDDDLTQMWTEMEALQSKYVERLSQRRTSNAASTNERVGIECMSTTGAINPGATLDRYENIPSIPVNPPLYSQVAPMHD